MSVEVKIVLVGSQSVGKTSIAKYGHIYAFL